MKEFKICFTDEKYAVYFYKLIYNTGTTAILNRDSVLIIEAELIAANENGLGIKLADGTVANFNNQHSVFMIVKDLEN